MGCRQSPGRRQSPSADRSKDGCLCWNNWCWCWKQERRVDTTSPTKDDGAEGPRRVASPSRAGLHKSAITPKSAMTPHDAAATISSPLLMGPTSAGARGRDSGTSAAKYSTTINSRWVVRQDSPRADLRTALVATVPCRRSWGGRKAFLSPAFRSPFLPCRVQRPTTRPRMTGQSYLQGRVL